MEEGHTLIEGARARGADCAEDGGRGADIGGYHGADLCARF